MLQFKKFYLKFLDDVEYTYAATNVFGQLVEGRVLQAACKTNENSSVERVELYYYDEENQRVRYTIFSFVFVCLFNLVVICNMQKNIGQPTGLQDVLLFVKSMAQVHKGQLCARLLVWFISNYQTRLLFGIKLTVMY